ncbi:DUF6048 family protein [Costertonia aggregata]|uniref:Uncharacterized protein n=1 Tax=Costertonia aggregata TaxID=343403 RepID=A0A7H9AKZ1_9FLAO|nr:DUF6048 family protein [Costertonia aggregata]QLG44136.1 hypothetical protein HYG79_01805 [Costertonia aggregata]
MLRYFISSCLVFLVVSGYSQSQNKPIDLQPKDTIVYKQEYGLRAGIDLSKLLLTSLNDDYQGFEIVGDYRLNEKLFLAAELGNEKKTQTESVIEGRDLYDYTTSGSYLKVGVDYNTYKNWYGENNSVFVGARYAISRYNQTLNNFRYYDSNRYWNDDFPVGSAEPIDFDGLTASWIELLFGAKVELFANIYIGASVRLGILVTQEKGVNNLWIPSFNKVTDNSRFGANYNYSISYFLPLYKKEKKKKEPKESIN